MPIYDDKLLEIGNRIKQLQHRCHFDLEIAHQEKSTVEQRHDEVQKELTNKLKQIKDLEQELNLVFQKVQSQSYSVSDAQSKISVLKTSMNASMAELDRIQKEHDVLKNKYAKYSSPEYTEYCSLVMEKQHFQELQQAQRPKQQTSAYGLHENPDPNGRALAKINLYKNMSESLTPEWQTQLKEKHQLDLVEKQPEEEKLRFAGGDPKYEIHVNKETVITDTPKSENSEAVARAMVAILLKSVKNIAEVSGYSCSSPDPEFKKLLEKTMAFELREKGITDVRINGVPLDKILSPATDLDEEAVNVNRLRMS